jgi:hypothetical protein
VTNNIRSISLWRGALGGVLGNLAKAAVVSLFLLLSPGRFDDSLLLLGVLGIPAAAIMGVVIAAILRLIARRYSFGVFGRATIGGALLLALGAIAYTLGVSGWSIDDISTWIVATLFYSDFGIATGAVAGIMAGRKKSAKLQ